jgi:hypothetical protein
MSEGTRDLPPFGALVPTVHPNLVSKFYVHIYRHSKLADHFSGDRRNDSSEEREKPRRLGAAYSVSVSPLDTFAPCACAEGNEAMPRMPGSGSYRSDYMPALSLSTLRSSRFLAQISRLPAGPSDRQLAPR